MRVRARCEKLNIMISFVLYTTHINCHGGLIMADGMNDTCNTHMRDKNAFKSLVGKYGDERSLERPGHILQSNTKLCLVWLRRNGVK